VVKAWCIVDRVRREAPPMLFPTTLVRQRRTVNLEYVQEGSIRNLRRLAAKTVEERRRNFDELRRIAAFARGDAPVPPRLVDDRQRSPGGGHRLM